MAQTAFVANDGLTHIAESDAELSPEDLQQHIAEVNATLDQKRQEAQANAQADARTGQAQSYTNNLARQFAGTLASPVRGVGAALGVPALIRGGNDLEARTNRQFPADPKYTNDAFGATTGQLGALAGYALPLAVPGAGEYLMGAQVAGSAYDAGQREAQAAGLPASDVSSYARANTAVETPLMFALPKVFRGAVTGLGVHGVSEEAAAALRAAGKEIPTPNPYATYGLGVGEAAGLGGTLTVAGNALAGPTGYNLDPNRGLTDNALSSAASLGGAVGLAGLPGLALRRAFGKSTSPASRPQATAETLPRDTTSDQADSLASPSPEPAAVPPISQDEIPPNTTVERGAKTSTIRVKTESGETAAKVPNDVVSNYLDSIRDRQEEVALKNATDAKLAFAAHNMGQAAANAETLAPLTAAAGRGVTAQAVAENVDAPPIQQSNLPPNPSTSLDALADGTQKAPVEPLQVTPALESSLNNAISPAPTTHPDVASPLGLEPTSEAAQAEVPQLRSGEATEVATVPAQSLRPSRQDVMQMTPEQLSDTAQKSKTLDDSQLVGLFGEEGAAKYKRLSRSAESSISSVSDKASAALSAMEESLTPQQQSSLYGIGETGLQTEELSDLADRVNGVDSSRTPEELAQELMFAATHVRPGADINDLDGREFQAGLLFKHAADVIRKRNLNPNDVLQKVIQKSAGRFSDANDAVDMLRPLLDAIKESKATQPTAEQGQLPARADQTQEENRLRSEGSDSNNAALSPSPAERVPVDTSDQSPEPQRSEPPTSAPLAEETPVPTPDSQGLQSSDPAAAQAGATAEAHPSEGTESNSTPAQLPSLEQSSVSNSSSGDPASSNAPSQEQVPRIISSAVRAPEGEILTGARYNEAHEGVGVRNGLDEVPQEQRGFLVADADGKQRFANREEALQIARNAGQLRDPGQIEPLQSQDLSQRVDERGKPITTVTTAPEARPADNPNLGTRTDRPEFQLASATPEYSAETAKLKRAPGEDALLEKAYNFLEAQRPAIDKNLSGYASFDPADKIIDASIGKFHREVRKGLKTSPEQAIKQILRTTTIDFERRAGARRQLLGGSLDEPVGDEGSGTRGDVTAAPSEPDYEAHVAAQNAIDAITEPYKASLSKSESNVLERALDKARGDLLRNPMSPAERKAFKQFQEYAQERFADRGPKAESSADLPEAQGTSGELAPANESLSPAEQAARERDARLAERRAREAQAKAAGPGRKDGGGEEKGSRAGGQGESSADAKASPLIPEHEQALSESLAQTKAAFANLGVEVVESDRDSGTGFSVAYNNDGARLKINRKQLAKNIATHDAEAGSRFIRDGVAEELVHAADLADSRARWEASGKRVDFDTFFQGDKKRLLTKIQKDFAALPESSRKVAEGALLDGWNLYHVDQQIKSVEELFNHLDSNPTDVANFMAESLRQLVQARKGMPTETGYLQFVQQFRQFVERMLRRLKQVAADPKAFSPALADAIKRIEDIQRGVSDGRLEAAKTRDPDALKIQEAYRRLVERDGFTTVRNSDLIKESGVAPEKVKQFILDEAKAGRAVPSRGDESLMGQEGKDSSVMVRGEAHPQVRLTGLEGRLGAAPVRDSSLPPESTEERKQFDPERELIQKLTGIEPPKPTREPIQYPSAREQVGKAAEGVKTFGQRAAKFVNGIGDLRPLTDKDVLLRRVSSLEQENSFFAKNVRDSIAKAVPDLKAREAIDVYRDLGGDRAKLEQAAREASKPANKARYERALNLTPDELKVVDYLNDFYKAMGEDAQRRGTLTELRENYANRYVKRPYLERLGVDNGAGGGGRFTKRFRSSNQRYYETIPDVEKSGRSLDSYDAAELAGRYAYEYGKLLTTEQLFEDAKEAKASDGRPLVDTKAEPPKISPDATDAEFEAAKKADRSDYVPTGAQGVFGNLAFHPEATMNNGNSSDIRNIFKTSAIQKYLNSPSSSAGEATVKLGVRALRKGQNILRATLLDGSPFHGTTEAIHTAGHGVSPIGPIEHFDPSNPDHQKAINAGLQIVHRIGSEKTFADDMQAGSDSLLRKVPFVRDLAKGMSDLVFEGMIPSYKLKIFRKALDRNLKLAAEDIKSGKLTEYDVEAATADQVNDGLGHQNYTALARNPTMQDIFRMLALAPDFLESRYKFAKGAIEGAVGALHGQGIGSREQLRTFSILLGGQVIMTRLFNKWTDDDYHWDHPFSFVHGNRAYTLRSVPEDAFAAITDPAKFSAGRESPLLRTLVQLSTGRNYRGERTTAAQTLRETATSGVPISLKGLPYFDRLNATQRNQVRNWWDNAFDFFGIHATRLSPEQSVYTLANQFKASKGILEDTGSHPTSAYTPFKQALQDNNPDRAKSELSDLMEKGKTRAQLFKAIQASVNRPFTQSQAMDQEFLKTLTPEQRVQFQNAKRERVQILQRARALIQQVRPMLTGS